MALTQDGLPIDHVEQVRQFCAAGARWVQLRMKTAPLNVIAATAAQVVAICRAHGATCIINDHVDIAIAVGADGAHLGRLDLDWNEARRRLGPNRVLGGTVNNVGDAARGREAGCLDYVGVGPLRFTTTKQKLAPVLGFAGVRQLIDQLGDLPAWVIGGVQLEDLPALRACGAAGVAVSQGLLRHGRIQENVHAFLGALGENGTSRSDLGGTPVLLNPTDATPASRGLQ